MAIKIYEYAGCSVFSSPRLSRLYSSWQVTK